MLSDPVFAEEFDTVVDEIADRYVEGEFSGEELARVEKHFLSTRERQNKVMFARELRSRAEAERGEVKTKTPVIVQPGILERVSAFFMSKPIFATAMAAIVIVAGIAIRMQQNRPLPTYATIGLTISSSDRATGAKTESVKPKPEDAGVRVELALPEQALQAKDFRVELLEPQGSSRNVSVAERKPQSLVVEIPSDQLTRGRYIVQLHAVNPDGSTDRVRGSYFFVVE